MRMIDADALMPLFIKKANTMKDRHGVKLGDEWLLNYNDIKDVIDNAPAVDVKPFANVTFNKDELEQIVKDKVIEPIKNGELVIKEERPHGEWIYHKGLSESRECSVCGVWLGWSLVRNSFCPNCGADMRKEASDV